MGLKTISRISGIGEADNVTDSHVSVMVLVIDCLVGALRVKGGLTVSVDALAKR